MVGVIPHHLAERSRAVSLLTLRADCLIQKVDSPGLYPLLFFVHLPLSLTRLLVGCLITRRYVHKQSKFRFQSFATLTSAYETIALSI